MPEYFKLHSLLLTISFLTRVEMLRFHNSDLYKSRLIPYTKSTNLYIVYFYTGTFRLHPVGTINLNEVE